MYALINSTIYTSESILTDHAVVIENDKIQKIVLSSNLPKSIDTVDLKGYNLSAGFIDLQLNGCGGVMFNGAETKQTLQIMQAANLNQAPPAFSPLLLPLPIME